MMGPVRDRAVADDGLVVAYGPDVCGDGLGLSWRELRPTVGGHGGAILFGSQHAFGNGFGESGEAAIAPEPFVLGEVGTERRSAAGGSVAEIGRAHV